jgi:hypothetical protein
MSGATGACGGGCPPISRPGHRPDDVYAFTILPRQWAVERTLCLDQRQPPLRLGLRAPPRHHEAMVLWAMITVMSRQLTSRTEA